jgi:hypothetical protein
MYKKNKESIAFQTAFRICNNLKIMSFSDQNSEYLHYTLIFSCKSHSILSIFLLISII